MDIPTSVRDCLRLFQNLESSDFLEHKAESLRLLQKEADRFKLWSANLAAHRQRQSQRSLEYRLRDSGNLRETVLTILSDLRSALEELSDTNKCETNLASIDDDDDDDDDDDGTAEAEDESDSESSEDELADIVHCVALLYRFSTTLRTPAGHSRMKNSLNSAAQAYYSHDLAHVKTKFPSLDNQLAVRFAVAMTKRRQYFKYREEHHQRLAAGLEDGNAEDDHQATTTASTVHKTQQDSLHDIGQDDAQSYYSATSYALSESDEYSLAPPQLPEEGRDEEPFECPICFYMLSVPNENAWRRHVYEDLSPYACTQLNCPTPNMQYARRREWQRHEKYVHFVTWSCPFSCNVSLPDQGSLTDHLRGHYPAEDLSTISRLSQACALPAPATMSLKCNMCDKMCASVNLWYKHVGHHQQQLALFCLPHHLLDLDDEDDELISRTNTLELINSESDGSDEDVDDADASESIEDKAILSSNTEEHDSIVGQRGQDHETPPAPTSSEFNQIPANPSRRQALESPETSMPESALLYFFIEGKGIDDDVITGNIQRYLGNEATVRPWMSEGGVEGYRIRAYRNFTQAMIEELRADTKRWRDAQRKAGSDYSYHEWSTMNPKSTYSVTGLSPGPLNTTDPPEPYYHGSSPLLYQEPNRPATPRPRDPKLVYCLFPGCTRSYNRKADLQRHVDATHNRYVLQLVDCLHPECSRKGNGGFTRTDKMRDHMRDVHGWEIPKRGGAAKGGR